MCIPNFKTKIQEENQYLTQNAQKYARLKNIDDVQSPEIHVSGVACTAGIDMRILE